MKILLWLWLGTAGALAAEKSNAFRVISAQAAPELNALYQRTNGWVGADANYPVPMTPERTLLFFGDTWLGKIVHDHRTNVTMINNTMGVLTQHGGERHIDFFWHTNAAGKATGFFMPEDRRGWMWPFAGAYLNGQLQILLHQMERGPGGPAFGFKTANAWLATVDNPMDPPPNWHVSQKKFLFLDLTNDSRRVFGAAILLHDGFAYVYGYEEEPKKKFYHRPMILARVETNAVADFTRWKFFRDGKWQDDFRAASLLAPGVPTEYSVTYVPVLKRFLCVGNDVFLSPRIMGRTAPEPWGPWSEPVLLYEPPDVQWSKKVFCYAGKVQPSLSTSDELVVSYAANSSSMAEVINDARLYWPRLARVKLAP